MAAEEQRTPALCAARTRLHGLLRPRHDALLAQFVQFVRNPATREILMAGGSADGDGGSADCSGGDSADGRRRHDPAALMADNTRIKSVLGWQPDYDDLNTIVRTALAWEKIWQQKKAGH